MPAAVHKVVFPIAGLGIRMLPATKACPKELFPLVDRPIIQYGVEEAVRAGIREVVFVASPWNKLAAAHFGPHPELEAMLTERGKTEVLAAVRAISTMARVTTINQPKPRGLGHAVLMAKAEVGNAPFGVMLPDDVIDADPCALRQMIDVHAEFDGPVLLVERVPREEVGRYGVIVPEPIRPGVYRVRDLVEKPAPSQAPSDLAIIGRYLLTPDLFAALERTGEDASGEIQLTDGLRQLARERPLYACELKGVRHDAGNKLGYLQATLHFALKHHDLGPQLRKHLASLK